MPKLQWPRSTRQNAPLSAPPSKLHHILKYRLAAAVLWFSCTSCSMERISKSISQSAVMREMTVRRAYIIFRSPRRPAKNVSVLICHRKSSFDHTERGDSRSSVFDSHFYESTCLFRIKGLDAKSLSCSHAVRRQQDRASRKSRYASSRPLRLCLGLLRARSARSRRSSQLQALLCTFLPQARY